MNTPLAYLDCHKLDLEQSLIWTYDLVFLCECLQSWDSLCHVHIFDFELSNYNNCQNGTLYHCATSYISNIGDVRSCGMLSRRIFSSAELLSVKSLPLFYLNLSEPVRIFINLKYMF